MVAGPLGDPIGAHPAGVGEAAAHVNVRAADYDRVDVTVHPTAERHPVDAIVAHDVRAALAGEITGEKAAAHVHVVVVDRDRIHEEAIARARETEARKGRPGAAIPMGAVSGRPAAEVHDEIAAGKDVLAAHRDSLDAARDSSS